MSQDAQNFGADRSRSHVIDPRKAACQIDERRDELVEAWAQLVSEEVAEAQQMDAPALVDDVPDILNLLADALRRGDVDELDNFEPVRAHGEQRAALTHAGVTTVLHEIRLLRSVLLDHIQNSLGALASSDVLLLYDVFERISEISVEAYIDWQLGREEEARRQAEQSVERLRELTDMLEEERERRELFVSAIVHDLRTPLSSLQIAADLLDSFVDRPDLREKALAKLHRNIDRLSAMAQRLLDVNRITAGQRLPLDIEECELVSLLKDQIDDARLAHSLDEDGAMSDDDEIVLDAPERAGDSGEYAEIRGWWNCDAVTRIVSNLVENALKYGQLPVTVRVRSEGDDGDVYIDIHDEGEPIPAEGQDRIFERFVRLESASALHKDGWGIGLTLVRGLAEALGGELELESRQGEGTTFTVRLPRDARPFQEE